MTWLLVGFAVGFMLCFIISVFVFTWFVDERCVGQLREDRSDDQPYYFLEVRKGRLSRLNRYKYVILRVEHKNYITK